MRFTKALSLVAAGAAGIVACTQAAPIVSRGLTFAYTYEGFTEIIQVCKSKVIVDVSDVVKVDGTELKTMSDTEITYHAETLTTHIEETNKYLESFVSKGLVFKEQDSTEVKEDFTEIIDLWTSFSEHIAERGSCQGKLLTAITEFAYCSKTFVKLCRHISGQKWGSGSLDHTFARIGASYDQSYGSSVSDY